MMMDDPNYLAITYRRGASNRPTAVLQGTGIRVQTLVVAAQDWGLSVEQIASEYNLSQSQVEEALMFYEAHRQEIELDLAAEQALEKAEGWV
jgi:uncharacterized protein (DUF433 family)